MTTPNGHHQVAVFEGVELPPDAETPALLALMALADDVEAGRLTEEGHQRARAALTALRRGVEREPSSSGRRWPWRRPTCGGRWRH